MPADVTGGFSISAQPRLDGTIELPRDQPERLVSTEPEERALAALGHTLGHHQPELLRTYGRLRLYTRGWGG
jgi:hypothetical protein